MSTKNADGIDMKCNSNDVIGELLDSKEDHCILVIASDIHSNMDKKLVSCPSFELIHIPIYLKTRVTIKIKILKRWVRYNNYANTYYIPHTVYVSLLFIECLILISTVLMNLIYIHQMMTMNIQWTMIIPWILVILSITTIQIIIQTLFILVSINVNYSCVFSIY